MATEAKEMAARIAEAGPGRAFTASDFSDVTSARNAGNVLGRTHARGDIARAVRGIYYVPERSGLLGAEVPASVDEVVRAIARANKWVVAPAGDAALNALGLDTQVPARPVYVSSEPYKSYSYMEGVGSPRKTPASASQASSANHEPPYITQEWSATTSNIVATFIGAQRANSESFERVTAPTSSQETRAAHDERRA